MEDTLGVANGGKTQEAFSSLNPCSNGRYSRRDYVATFDLSRVCLNPCSNGRYSRSFRTITKDEADYES